MTPGSALTHSSYIHFLWAAPPHTKGGQSSASSVFQQPPFLLALLCHCHCEGCHLFPACFLAWEPSSLTVGTLMVLWCQAGTVTPPVPALSPLRYREGSQLQYHQAGMYPLLMVTVSTREPGHEESALPTPCLSPASQHHRGLPSCAFVVGLGYSSACGRPGLCLHTKNQR